MEFETIIEVLQTIGLRHSVRPDHVQVEAPPRTGRSINISKLEGSDVFRLLTGFELESADIELLGRVPEWLVKRAKLDVISYACLFDTDHQFDTEGGFLHSCQFMTRWAADEDPRVLLDRIQLLSRARDGVLHKARFWFTYFDREAECDTDSLNSPSVQS